MGKQIFKEGDKVYHYEFGWGTVKEVTDDTPGYPVRVEFKEGNNTKFSADGRYAHIQKPTLSFTWYDFGKGVFSQERPESSDIGKWGKFWDCIYRGGAPIIDRLDSEEDGLFYSEIGLEWENFEPLTNEQIEILGL